MDGGGARPTRLAAFFALDGWAPLGPDDFVFARLAFVAAGTAGLTSGVAAAAAAVAGKMAFGIRFLFAGMVEEIMANTSPTVGPLKI